MEWNTTWEDPLTSYVKHFAGLIGDQRTRKTFGETVKGIIAAGSLICQQIAARSAELSKGNKGVKCQLFRIPYGNYFCRFLNSGLPCFLLKLLVMVGLGSTIALDLHHIQNDGVMDDAIYGRQRGHRVFEDLV